MVHALGWLGSALIVASLAQDRALPFRLLNLASAVVLLVFNVAIELWSMVALNSVILIVNSWQLRRLVTSGVHGRTVEQQANDPPRLDRERLEEEDDLVSVRT
jgi:uncharacterized membrane protein YqjE